MRSSSAHPDSEASTFYVLACGLTNVRIERSIQRSDIMRSSPRVVSTGLALSIVLLSFVPVASAGPKEDVGVATQAWGRALGEDDPDKVLPFYANDAVLWGTLSPTVRGDRAALRDYFVTAFKVLPG